MSRRLAVLAALTAACVAGPALAQEAAEPEATRVDDVVVSGTTLRRQVQVFVTAVTAPPRGHGPARWNAQTGVCVSVVNLRREAAQVIADRCRRWLPIWD